MSHTTCTPNSWRKNENKIKRNSNNNNYPTSLSRPVLQQQQQHARTHAKNNRTFACKLALRCEKKGYSDKREDIRDGDESRLHQWIRVPFDNFFLDLGNPVRSARQNLLTAEKERESDGQSV
ncbi:hypothetical protein OUZ56_030157 [Daphnia magna]|uniref:Uncharacterized protein n=1 Tax=Daphnia magna TaxID=35525 RepID=A0ABQ9ZQG0_9CRUS|nr:hypothetical protein OUZ56_030157 [Daphnia magna]